MAGTAPGASKPPRTTISLPTCVAAASVRGCGGGARRCVPGDGQGQRGGPALERRHGGGRRRGRTGGGRPAGGDLRGGGAGRAGGAIRLPGTRSQSNREESGNRNKATESGM